MIREIEHLDQLAALEVEESTDQLNIDFWVPSEDISVYEAELPNVPPKKQIEMLPWILEDQLLRPVDELHFSIGAKTSEKHAFVYVVAKEAMHRWLMMAESKSVIVEQLAPDFLALPIEDNYWTVNVQGSRLIVRTGQHTGFAADTSLGWQLLELEFEKVEDIRIAAIVEDEEVIPENWRDKVQAQVGALNWGFVDLPEANLLSGEFKQVPQKSITPWVPSMAVGALALVLAIVYMVVQSHQWQKELVNIDEGIASAYRSLYGEAWNGPRSNVRVSAEARTRLFEHQYISLQQSPLAQLRAVEPALSACPTCGLKAVVQNKNSVNFTLIPQKDLKKRLNGISGVDLSWGAANAEGVAQLTATLKGNDG